MEAKRKHKPERSGKSIVLPTDRRNVNEQKTDYWIKLMKDQWIFKVFGEHYDAMNKANVRCCHIIIEMLVRPLVEPLNY